MVSQDFVVQRAMMCVPNTLSKSQRHSQGHCEGCRLGILACCKQVGVTGLSSPGRFGSFWLCVKLNPVAVLLIHLAGSTHPVLKFLLAFAGTENSFTSAVCWGEGSHCILIQHGTVHNCLGSHLSLSVHTHPCKTRVFLVCAGHQVKLEEIWM